jgi:hypothetical protein
MSFEQQVLATLEEVCKGLAQIQAEVAALRVEVSEIRADKHNEPPDIVVGTDYVAKVWGITVDAVRKKRYGTKDIPRLPGYRILFSKLAVDKHLAKLRNKPSVKQRAAALVQSNAPKKRKQSILTK